MGDKKKLQNKDYKNISIRSAHRADLLFSTRFIDG